MVCGHCLVTLSLTINATLKWLTSQPLISLVVSADIKHHVYGGAGGGAEGTKQKSQCQQKDNNKRQTFVFFLNYPVVMVLILFCSSNLNNQFTVLYSVCVRSLHSFEMRFVALVLFAMQLKSNNMLCVCPACTACYTVR